MRNFLIAILCVVISVTTGIEAGAGETTGELSRSHQIPDEVESDLPLGPLLLGSFGAVFLAVGAGFGWQAKEEYDDFNEASTSPQPGGPLYPKASDDLAADIRAHSIVANVLMFSGVAAMAGGIIWWLVDKKDDNPESGASQGEKSVSITPLLGPGHAGLSLEF